jgi:hypothetical protein
MLGLGGILLLLGYNVITLGIATAVAAAAVLLSEAQWRAQGRLASFNGEI